MVISGEFIVVVVCMICGDLMACIPAEVGGYGVDGIVVPAGRTEVGSPAAKVEGVVGRVSSATQGFAVLDGGDGFTVMMKGRRVEL